MSATGPTRVIGVASGKGGVGKTNVCVNLALSLANLGQRVTLLDADLGLANVDVLLGLKPERTLQQVLAGECSVADVLLPGPGGLQVAPAASGEGEMTALSARGRAGIIGAFDVIAGATDTLVVDTAAGVSADVLTFMAAASDVMVVICNEPTSITDGYALIKMLWREHDVDHVHVVVNMTGPGERGEAAFARLERVTERFLDVTLEYAGAIPRDAQLRRAVGRQRAVVDAFPGSDAARAFDALARRVAHWPAPAFPGGGVAFFLPDRVAAQGAALR
ncbi:MAG: MinD/ParA family protein [Pseudomonadota bacterium]